MTVVPTGAPAWTRTASHVHYGGHTEKENYLSNGSIDETTDIDADEWCRFAADLEACVRTCDFAQITYLNHDASPDAPTIESARLMVGVEDGGYEGDAPPGVMPGATRSGNGVVVFTFAESYADPYGVVGAFTPVIAEADAHGTTAAEAVCTISGQTVTVRVFDAAGNAVLDVRVTLYVS